MSYKSPLPLLEDMYRTLEHAVSVDAAIAEEHSNPHGSLWPSLASIRWEEFDDITGQYTPKLEGACLRRGWYQMRNVKQTGEMSARGFKVTTMGTIAEEIFKQWFRGVDGYRMVFPNIQGRKLRFANPRTKLRGEVDIVMEHIETKTKFGVEMKTYDGPDAALALAGFDITKSAYGANMRYIRVGDAKRQTKPFPKIDNLVQTMIYLEEFWTNPGIRLWKIVYGARDKGPDVEFDITLQELPNNDFCAVVNGEVHEEFKLSSVHQRFQELIQYIKDETLPPRDYVPEYDSDEILKGDYPKWMKDKVAGKLKDDDDPVVRDWRCKFCPYLDLCLNEPQDQAPF